VFGRIALDLRLLVMRKRGFEVDLTLVGDRRASATQVLPQLFVFVQQNDFAAPTDSPIAP
jgi:hypothetical protein